MNVSKVLTRSKIFYHSIIKVHYLIEVLSERMHGKYSSALFDSAELSSCFLDGNGRIERITSRLPNKRNSLTQEFF